jgi:hypothetical protein
MNRLITILFILLLLSGCEKFQSPRIKGYGVEFYLIKDFKLAGTYTRKIDNSSVVLSDSVIIYYDNIISYSDDTYTFTVTKDVADRLDDFKNNKIHGKAFAVTVDKKIIYTGYFWCGFSSSSVDWVTIDPLNYSGKNLLPVSLGYPGLFEGDYIPDNRNDPELLNLLRRDSKLNK